jgi:hypothetical protein
MPAVNPMVIMERILLPGRDVAIHHQLIKQCMPLLFHQVIPKP